MRCVASGNHGTRRRLRGAKEQIESWIAEDEADMERFQNAP
jgi:hypothetical protein